MGELTGSNDSDKIPIANMTNIVPMADNANLVVTAHAALTADNAVLAVANSKTAIRYWEAGTFQNGTPNTGDIIVFTDTVTTSGGSATFFPTSDHTGTGSALCSYLSANSFQPNYRDSSGVYAPGAVTVGGTLKSIAQAFAKQTFSGVTVVTINVLGSVSNSAIPDAVTVMASWWGISV